MTAVVTVSRRNCRGRRLSTAPGAAGTLPAQAREDLVDVDCQEPLRSRNGTMSIGVELFEPSCEPIGKALSPAE